MTSNIGFIFSGSLLLFALIACGESSTQHKVGHFQFKLPKDAALQESVSPQGEPRLHISWPGADQHDSRTIMTLHEIPDSSLSAPDVAVIAEFLKESRLDDYVSFREFRENQFGLSYYVTTTVDAVAERYDGSFLVPDEDEASSRSHTRISIALFRCNGILEMANTTKQFPTSVPPYSISPDQWELIESISCNE